MATLRDMRMTMATTMRTSTAKVTGMGMATITATATATVTITESTCRASVPPHRPSPRARCCS